MAEQDLRYRLIAAGGRPGRAEVAAADVHGDNHVLRLCFEDLVEHINVLAADLIYVDTALCICLALLSRTEFAPGGIIELQIPAAGSVERLYRLLVSSCQIVQQNLLVLVALDRLVVGRTNTADQMQHGRRRNALLGLYEVGGHALQECKMLEERMIIREIQLVHDLYGLSLRLEALECDGEVLGLDLLRTSQTPEEVHVPEGTAILAVGDSVQTDILFLLYQTGDLGIFDLGQFFSGNFAGFKLAASFVDSLCAQEAADNIITIRSGIFHGGCPF